MEKPELTTLVEVLRWRALHQPDRLAYTFLLDGETQEARMTYAQLDRRARTIAAWLQNQAASQERALLVYPPGLEFIAGFFGCLYAGIVAIPVYPPHSPRLDKSLPKLRAIASDAEPFVALTSSAHFSLMESIRAQAPDLQAIPWLATDTIDSGLAEQWQEPAVDGIALAFLQYTSGSTMAPRGVMLTHGNLMHNSATIERCFEHTVETRGVIWLPSYHDMGLIGGIIQPLYAGFPATLMSPVAFLQRPLRWLQAISRTRAMTCGGPPFAYDLCARKITPEQRASLDLSSWDMAFIGAEPIRNETLERFVETFAPCGFRREAFYPCYGLAEATLIASGGLKSAPPVVFPVQNAALERNRVVAVPGEVDGAQVMVGCGQSIRDQMIVIVNPESLISCAPDEVGEIWVAGPSVAQGYWNRPEETERTFHARLADTGEGPFLRTGDLGFLKDGELFVTGRLKDLIIVAGQNHYPQDIESTVERSHPSIRPGACAAFSFALDGEERLVIATEVERRSVNEGAGWSEMGALVVARAPGAEIVQAIRRAVAESHELRVHAVLLLKAGTIPKTSSGKIQRHVCRTSFLAGSTALIQE